MMQRVLYNKTLRQVAAMHRVLVGVSTSERPVGCCWPPPRLSAGSRRSLSASAPSYGAQHPKPKPQQQPPSEEEPLPCATPRAQLTQHDVHREEASATDSSSSAAQGDSQDIDPLQDKSISLFQRFKKTFKQYGKVMIPVHLVTSTLWFGSFYYAAMKGVNVVQFLEFVGLPESIIGLLRDSSSGYALTAYAMYKIATPARYTVTLGGTSLSVQYLRKHGYFSTPPPVKDYIQDKMEETKEKLSEKMENTKERLTEKMEETKELFSERMEETKDRISEKMEETKDKFSERLQETKDKVSEGKSFFRKKAD